MPRLGGEADKFGNRYESLWVVDAALDLIDGEYMDLVLEEVGDEDAGVEFVRTNLSGTREYHSIKRQQSGGNWTISRLTQRDPSTNRSILSDLVQKIQQGATAVFSSGTSADEIRELHDQAIASSSLEEFQERIRRNARLSGRFQTKIVPICGAPELGYSALKSLFIRIKLETDLIKDVERRIRSMFRTRTGNTLDPTATRLLMAEFGVQRLGATLTPGSFMSYLSDHGILPSRLYRDSAVSERLQQLSRVYRQGVNRFLINRTEITRSESTEAFTALIHNGKSVMLEGTAGGGKSCALAQVVERLNAHEIPTIVLSLDRLVEADVSAQAIGARQGLPDSPVITLGKFAGPRRSVLCIDQLDALSMISARQQSAWPALTELLEETRDYPNMRILFACRSFDLEQDGQLRALVADESRIERIPVNDLDDETIIATITASGFVGRSLSPSQLRILSVPLHLYLFLETSRSGEFDFANRGDLFDAFWRHKAQAVERRLGGSTQEWPQAIATLCDAMSERESLVAPDYVMDQFRGAMEAMASEAVIQVQDCYVRFFHETFFDYSFARTFLRSNNDLVEWLEADQQQLFRRSQVRQVLSFLRDREPDISRYLSTVQGLLGNSNIRFHIKKLVLDWLRSHSDPMDAEWSIIEGLRDELGGHVWQVVSDSVSWFDLLQETGRLGHWLAADDQSANRVLTLLRMPEILSFKSAAVASLVSPFRGQSPEWSYRLRWLVEGGQGFTSLEMQDLVISLITDGTLDNARPGVATNSDWWSIWSMSARQEPQFMARVLGAWLDRRLIRTHCIKWDDPSESVSELMHTSNFSEKVIKDCASLAPLAFVQEMFPRFASLDNNVPRELVWAPNWLGNPDEQLREGLANAMVSLARENPSQLATITDDDNLGKSKWMSSLLLRAWSSNPDFFGEHIFNFLMECPERRLNIGYDISIGNNDRLATVSRAAIAAASSVCSDDSLVRLEDAILLLTPDWERESRQVGRTRLALLRALPQDRVRDSTRRSIQELERRFPEARERGAPQISAPRHFLQRVGPPISEEAQPHMSDDQWLAAMEKYSSGRPVWLGDQIIGDAEQLSVGLEKLVRVEPSRFASLANRMVDKHSPVYFEAILGGLSYRDGRLGRAGTLEEVSSVLRRINHLGISVSGVAIARAIRELADEEIPRDIQQLLCRVALHDPDPAKDDWLDSEDDSSPDSHAINSARGAAADALSQLLFANTSRWASLRTTIGHLVSDPVLSVRSLTTDSLLAVLDTNRIDALYYFEKLTAGADAILGSPRVEQFIHYAIFRDYFAVRPLLVNMLNSSNPAAVRVAAKQAIVAALWIEEAHKDEHYVLENGEESRAGAAFVYANNLSNETVETKCEERLSTLFADESEVVRAQANRCWAALDPNQISSRGPLIHAFAQAVRSARDVNLLAYRLNDARKPVPAEVCDLAERAIETFGPKAASIQYEESGAAYELATLMIRLHEQTNDPFLRNRVLDAIDQMIWFGFYGVNEQVRKQYERWIS